MRDLDRVVHCDISLSHGKHDPKWTIKHELPTFKIAECKGNTQPMIAMVEVQRRLRINIEYEASAGFALKVVSDGLLVQDETEFLRVFGKVFEELEMF